MTKNLTCLKCGAEYVAKKLFPFGKAACPSCGAKNPLRQKRTAETEEEGELLLTFAVDTLDEKALAKRDRVMAKNFKWKLLRDKSGYILQKCKKKDILTLVIPSTYKKLPVVAIADRAFEKHQTLTNITVEEGVQKIGMYAFFRCPKLESVMLPDSVTELGASAFSECQQLFGIVLSGGLAKIPPSAFYRCQKLEEITIPDSVTDVGDWSFGHCISLKAAWLGANVRRIGGNAFLNCDALKQIVVPDSVTNIEASAFYDCNALETVVIGNGVKTIQEQAFYGCEKLKNITLGNALTTIGSQAFERCKSLAAVSFPNGVTKIAHGAFAYCKALQTVELPEGLSEIGYRSFAWCGAVNVSIGGNVSRICKWAFYNCKKLTDVTYRGAAAGWGRIKQDAECWKNVPARKVNCTDEKAWLRKK